MPFIDSGKKAKNQLRHHEEGFVLSVVVLVGLILGMGAMALVTQGASSLISSIKQQQSQEALEVAQAGMEIMLSKLNTEVPSQLVLPFSEWSNEDAQSGIIQNAEGESIGRWTVLDYAYQGNKVYGGTGLLRIQGERLAESSATETLAKAEIEQQLSIKYKECVSHLTLCQYSVVLNKDVKPVALGTNRWVSFEQLNPQLQP